MTDMPKNVLLVLGEPRSGKSHLLKWCMESWAIGRARVRYIKLDDGTSKTFLSILRQIRDGDAPNLDSKTCYLHAGLPKSAFRQFNWHLNNLTETGALGDWVDAEHPEAEIPDAYRPLAALSDQRPEEQIAPLFLEALQTAAAGRLLVLVFDQLEGKVENLLPVNEFEQLVRHVILPIAETAAGLLKVAIVATTAQAASFKLKPISPRYADRVAEYKVPVNIKDDELAMLAAEMLWFQDEMMVTQIARSTFQLRNDQIPPPKGMARLFSVRKMIEAFNPNYLSAVGRMR
jgi:hypothetical protein